MIFIIRFYKVGTLNLKKMLKKEAFGSVRFIVIAIRTFIEFVFVIDSSYILV